MKQVGQRLFCRYKILRHRRRYHRIRQLCDGQHLSKSKGQITRGVLPIGAYVFTQQTAAKRFN